MRWLPRSFVRLPAGALPGALPGVLFSVLDVSFLFIFTRISGYFYFLPSTAFLMHFSAYTTVLKHLLIAHPSRGTMLFTSHT